MRLCKNRMIQRYFIYLDRMNLILLFENKFFIFCNFKIEYSKRMSFFKM